jgi:hypothetical protein
MTFSGDGTISGLVAGGLPNSTVQQADLAANVAGNGPAFFANTNITQTCTNSINTKLSFNLEVFDTNSNYDPSTYRFQPTVAGYYQISAGSSFVAGSATQTGIVQIWKTGSQYAIGSCSPAYSTIQNFMTVSTLVYLNGSTDYVEAYVYHNYGSNWNTSPGAAMWFCGNMVRSA